MPRKSVEDRVVVAPDGRASRGHPPPQGLSAPAKTIWRRIVTSKPSDWFDPGSLVLLAQYCEVAVQADALMARRRAMDLPGSAVDDAVAARLERRVAGHVKMLAILATKLRLSVQARVRYDDGRLDEKQPGAHRLLGGNVAPFTGPKR